MFCSVCLLWIIHTMGSRTFVFIRWSDAVLYCPFFLGVCLCLAGFYGTASVVRL